MTGKGIPSRTISIYTVKSGDVKGTLRNDLRYHFAPNDVRRHRLISISYTTLLPCHGGVQTPQTTDCESLANRGFAGPLGPPVCQWCARFRIHSVGERACCTISTKTFRVSAGLLTSLKNAMRAPRMPSAVFKRT